MMKVKIGNKDATAEIGSMSFTTSDETNGEEFSFQSLGKYEPGQIVTVSDGGTQFRGIIVNMEENTRPPHSYKALDFSWNLKNDEIIQFKNLRADKAIKKMLAGDGIDCSVCSIPTLISKIYKDTTINILKDILKKAKRDQGKDYFFEVRGSKVYVEQKQKIKVHPDFIMADDSSITRDIESLKNEVIITSNDKERARAWNNYSIGKVGTLRTVIDGGDKISTAKAESEALTQLKKLNRSTNTKTVNLLVTTGYWDIRKNRLIKLNGGGLKGWYNINSATHSIDGKKHMVAIEVVWHAKLS